MLEFCFRNDSCVPLIYTSTNRCCHEHGHEQRHCPIFSPRQTGPAEQWLKLFRRRLQNLGSLESVVSLGSSSSGRFGVLLDKIIPLMQPFLYSQLYR